MEKELWNLNDFSATTVTRTRSSDGKVEQVETASKHDTSVLFFASRALCEAKRDELINSGEINDPKELKYRPTM